VICELADLSCRLGQAEARTIRRRRRRHQWVGVARSLVREGVPTYLVDCDRGDPSMRTRHAEKITFPAPFGPAAIASLLALRQYFACDPVLFLTRIATVEAVSAATASVASCYRISMPAAAGMQKLMDKAGFQVLTEHHGLAIPRAVHLRRAESLAQSDALDYPCVLKPVVKTPAYERCFKRAYKVDNPTQLHAVFREIDGAAEMITQKWIAGGDDQTHFCLQHRPPDQRNIVSFTGCNLRAWPPETDGTASCVPAPEHGRELVRLTDAFFAAAGFIATSSQFYPETRGCSTPTPLANIARTGRKEFAERARRVLDAAR
jgi:D-aspartate ligase